MDLSHCAVGADRPRLHHLVRAQHEALQPDQHLRLPHLGSGLLAAEEILRDAFARQRGSHVAGLLAELDARTIGPHTAARRLLEKLHEEDHR